MLGGECNPCCGVGDPVTPACLSLCPVTPQQITFSVSAPSASGNPFVEPGTFQDTFFGTVTKRTNISFAAVAFSYVFDISRLLAQPSGILQVYRNLDGTLGGSLDHFGNNIGGLDEVTIDWSYVGQACHVRFRANQIAFTLQAQNNGPHALTGYAYEMRMADTYVSFGVGGVSVWMERSWSGQGYFSPGAGAGGRPFQTFRRDYAAASPPSCTDYATTPAQSSQGIGGFPGPLINDESGFCLVPVPNANDPPPEVGGEYGYMVGAVNQCSGRWLGNLRRVGSLPGFAEIAIE